MMIDKIIKFVNNLDIIINVKKSNHICILCKGGKIICHGINSDRSKVKKLDIYSLSLHAECDAIRKYLSISTKIKKVDMYIIRIHKDGRFSNSKPCEKCQKFIKSNYMINRVFYTDSNGTFIQFPFQ